MKPLLLIPVLFFALVSFGQETDRDFNKYGGPNVTASRLVGTWTTNTALTKRLDDRNDANLDTVTFVADPTAADSIPKKHFEYIKDKKIYLSGFMLIQQQRIPFLLIETDGNTRMLLYLDRNGIKYDNGESFILFIAVSGKKKNDLLCTGGDFNNQPFRAWDRIE